MLQCRIPSKILVCSVLRISDSRDGRTLREDVKPREMLAIDRFVSKGGGLMGSDNTLEDLGLHDLAPPNACRPATSSNLDH